MESPIKTRSAGGVVLNVHGDVLVVDQHGRAWSLPKGHIDPGENDLEAARREVKEESGISALTYVKHLGEYTRYKISKEGGDDMSELKTIVMFQFTTEQMELAPEDTHNQEARWVPRSEVADLLTHHKDKEFFLSVLDLLN